MLSLTTAVLWLFLIPLAYSLVNRTHHLFVNYLAARKIGIPIVVVPFSWQDTWWLLMWEPLRWLRHAPLIGHRIEVSHHGWPQDLRWRAHRRYGDVFVVVSPSHNEIVINDPTAGAELQTHYKTWIKPQPLYDIFETFGKGVISINGEDWQRHRKIVNPAFREQNNKMVWEESLKQARQMLEAVSRRPGASLTMDDVRHDCVLIAMHVLSAAGFGHVHDFEGGLSKVPPGHSRSLAGTLMYLLQNILMVALCIEHRFFGWIMPHTYKEVKELAAEFRQYMREVVAYNRATTESGGSDRAADIVSALVEADEAAKREDKRAGSQSGSKPMYLSDDELLGNLYVFNLAGVETTANALTYTIPFLAVNRAVQDWVGEEVDAVLQGAGGLDYEDAFPSLVRCMAVMYESLRLWGPVPDTTRWCAGDFQTLHVKQHDLIVPPKTYVTTNFYAIHGDPRWWGDDSGEWRPQRWILIDPQTGKESIAPPPAEAVFMPWSTGPRVCPGRKFSQVEFVAVISSILKRYRLEPLVMEGKMQTKEQASQALMDVVEDSQNIITPRMRRPNDAGVVFIERCSCSIQPECLPIT